MRGLRADVVGTGLVALAALVCLSMLARAGLSLSPFYTFKAAICFLLVAGIAIGSKQGHHPFSRFGPANQVTTVRAVLVALTAGLIGEFTSAAAAMAVTVTSVAATLLDGVDGWVARRTGMASDFGARFDMEVDALLVLVLAILVWRYDKAGAWVVLSGLLRYLFVVAVRLCPWMQRPLPPSFRRQAICVVQIGGLILAIAPIVPPSRSALPAAIALVALGYSFLVDTVWLWRSDGREQSSAMG